MPSRDKEHDLAAGFMDRLACYTTSDELGQCFDIEAIALDLIILCVLGKIPRQVLHEKIDELWTRMFGDPIGPGTPAWEASEATITHKINGRPDEAKASRDTMVRELLANGVSESHIRQWEDFIAGRVANPEPDDFD